jgi:hypothetical protein
LQRLISSLMGSKTSKSFARPNRIMPTSDSRIICLNRLMGRSLVPLRSWNGLEVSNLTSTQNRVPTSLWIFPKMTLSHQ